MRCGQTGDVGFYKWLEHLRSKAAHEDKREAARVREAGFVERHRLREVPLANGSQRLWLPAQTVPVEGSVQRLIEHDVRARHLIREEPLRLRDHGSERVRVRARLRESQVQELEHRFE